jgi:hypothetical protein
MLGLPVGIALSFAVSGTIAFCARRGHHRADVDPNLLKLIWTDLQAQRDNLIDRQAGKLRMLPTGLCTWCLKFTKRMLSISSYMAADPLHSYLVACRDDISADGIKLFGAERWQCACNHKPWH